MMDCIVCLPLDVGVCVFGGREKCCRLFKKERKGKHVAEDLSKLNISSVHALE
jgi:hypothetical protein